MSFGERFLELPDLFPARSAGAPWGEVDVEIDFAGGPYLVRGLTAAQEAVVRRHLGPLCRAAGENGATAPALEARLFRAARGDFRELPRAGWEYTLDLDYAPSAVRMTGLDLMARLDWRPSLGASLWTPVDGGAPFEGVFENFFRPVVAYALLARGGALLHSAGVVGSRGVYLFCGRSGAGKSTLSRLALAGGTSVLSDDLNALSGGSDRPVVEKVPFTGELDRSPAPGEARPLAGLLRLEKGAEDRVRPVSRGEALAALLASSPYANGDPYRGERLALNLERVLRRVPAGVLTFRKEARFPDLLEQVETTLGAGE